MTISFGFCVTEGMSAFAPAGNPAGKKGELAFFTGLNAV
jgi:hypothetical protein